MTVLSRPRHADAKNGVTNYQGLTTARENAIRNAVLEPRVTAAPPMRGFASLYFLIHHTCTFVCATLFLAIKLD